MSKCNSFATILDSNIVQSTSHLLWAHLTAPFAGSKQHPRRAGSRVGVSGGLDPPCESWWGRSHAHGWGEDGTSGSFKLWM